MDSHANFASAVASLVACTFALVCFRVRAGVFSRSRWCVFAFSLVCFRVRVGVFLRSRWCVFAFALVCFRVRVGVFSRSGFIF